MADELVSGLLREAGVRALCVVATQACREAARRHAARPAAATVLAQSMTAGLLLAALQKQKESSKVNLQLECDGPLRGLFVDADNEGRVRGYVKNPLVEFQAASEAFRFRPVLGNSGFLSVLRDLGPGEHYRSSVELSAFDLSLDLARYFQSSDQVDSAVCLEVLPRGAQALGQVAGVLFQLLPGGDAKVLAGLREALGQGAVAKAVGALEEAGNLSAGALLTRLVDGGLLEVLGKLPVAFACRCSREKVTGALLALGKAELEDLLEKDGKAAITCEFCATTYEVNGEELRSLLAHAG